MTKKLEWPDYIIAVVLFGVVVATLYPFVYMIAVSLSEDVYILKGEVTIWPKGFNLNMYRLVLSDPRIANAYINTIQYVAVGTFVSLLTTAAGAYAISKKELPHHKLFTLLIVFTMFFGGGMIPTFLVVKSYGLIDTLWAMVLPTAISTWNLIVMRTFFSGLPKEVEESGKLMGLPTSVFSSGLYSLCPNLYWRRSDCSMRSGYGTTFTLRCCICAIKTCIRCRSFFGTSFCRARSRLPTYPALGAIISS